MLEDLYVFYYTMYNLLIIIYQLNLIITQNIPLGIFTYMFVRK